MARSVDVLERRREVIRLVAEQKGVVRRRPKSKAAWMNRDIYSYVRTKEASGIEVKP